MIKTYLPGPLGMKGNGLFSLDCTLQAFPLQLEESQRQLGG
jgi:hypothetical protein